MQRNADQNVEQAPWDLLSWSRAALCVLLFFTPHHLPQSTSLDPPNPIYPSQPHWILQTPSTAVNLTGSSKPHLPQSTSLDPPNPIYPSQHHWIIQTPSTPVSITGSSKPHLPQSTSLGPPNPIYPSQHHWILQSLNNSNFLPCGIHLHNYSLHGSKPSAKAEAPT